MPMYSPASLIDELECHLKDGTKAERADILQRVTDLFLVNAEHASKEQVEVFDEVMIRLIEKIEDKILAKLSERLASIDNSPINVITQLSRHERIEVAGPVLEKSNRLTDLDLVEIAYTKSQAHLRAIAGRRKINPIVADALIRRGNAQVAMRVTANKGAAFSQTGFTKLVERALGDETLAEKITDRDDVPPELYEYLVVHAAEKVRKHLAATCSPARRAQIEALLTNISDRIVRQGSNSTSGSGKWSTKTLTKRELANLRTQLDELVSIGKSTDIIPALAKLAGIQDEIVKNVIDQGSEDGILIICKAGDIAWPTVRSVLTSRSWRNQPDEKDLKNISYKYFRFSSDNAERVLLFMKARKAMSAAEMSKLFTEA